MKREAKSLPELIRSMTAKEIIMNMVESLLNPEIKTAMYTFGYKDENGIYYGCAATASLCNLRNEWYSKEQIVLGNFGSEYVFLRLFSHAINHLRCGDISGYNEVARSEKFAVIKNTLSNKDEDYNLPRLYTNYKKTDLDVFIALAMTQPS